MLKLVTNVYPIQAEKVQSVARDDYYRALNTPPFLSQGRRSAFPLAKVFWPTMKASGGLPLTVTVSQAPSEGQLVLKADGSFTYTAVPSEGLRTVEFRYKVSDGSLLMASASSPANQPNRRCLQ